ncbi:nSTAND1 domain-containing NTPase, partial [Prochlorothrix hollandica]|uniref:nSTAND1 domain-containing NTPase n=1 Tax=Prochlorothrix hollandica TaxID=1223 RepID=UPI003DA6DFF0
MAELSAENQARLEQLADTLDLMAGESALILAVCPGRATQEQLIARLPECCAAIAAQGPVLFSVPAEAEEIYGPLRAFLTASGGDWPSAVSIAGLTELDPAALERVLQDLNRSRERFRQALPLPVVLWVDDRLQRAMTRQINDFKTWTTAVIFGPEPELQQHWLREQGETIQRGIEQADEFRPNGELLDAADAQELDYSLDQDLETLGHLWQLPTSLRGLVLFLQGRRAMERGQGDRALACFQQCGDYWPGTADDRGWGLVALHEAWVHRDRAWGAGGEARNHWERAHQAYGQGWERLRASSGPEVWAKWLHHGWQAQLALGQELEGALKAELAAADGIYGALEARQGLAPWWPYRVMMERVRARLAQSQPWEVQWAAVQAGVRLWQQGRELGGETWCLWLGERLRLGELGAAALVRGAQPAIVEERFLQETVDVVAALDADRLPQLGQRWGQTLVQLLQRLRQLLRARGEYGEAFRWKQQQRQWELQLGLRAFMGAGQFQVVGTGLAAEMLFAASGRGQQVDQLVERLRADAGKFLTVYGPSGVGKSTLVEAGLVPALEQAKFPMGRRGVPVLVRVYEDWQGEVLRLLRLARTTHPLAPSTEGGQETQPLAPSLEGGTQPLTPSLEGGLEGEIYGELGENAAANQVTILIFDQFEEFFAAAVTVAQREAFYGFVVECLRGTRVQFVKVVLSLREDYCQQLRGLDRFDPVRGLHTELFKEENAVFLGNFSKDQARTVIEMLAERANYGMEAGLVTALVDDLATEAGLVRPVQLQVVGAQLQGEGIRTVAQYEARIGGKVTSILSSTAPLVDGYIGEVVEDCGEQAAQDGAWGILLGLTNAQGLRPIRRREELEQSVACFGEHRGEGGARGADLDWVFEVLTRSGLVVQLEQGAADRFQLVHDYLVYPIRNKFPGYDLEQELQRQEAQRRQKVLAAENAVLAGASRQAGQRLLVGTGMALAVVVGAVVYSGTRLIQIQATLGFAQEATRLERAGAAAQKQFEFQQTEALLGALRAGAGLKSLKIAAPDSLTDYPASPLLALQTSVDTIRETRLEGHQGNVWSVQFSPQGDRIVTSGKDGTARLWDLQGQELTKFEGHQGWVMSVFSPQGDRIVTSGCDGTERLWEMKCKQLNTIHYQEGIVRSVQ